MVEKQLWLAVSDSIGEVETYILRLEVTDVEQRVNW